MSDERTSVAEPEPAPSAPPPSTPPGSVAGGTPPGPGRRRSGAIWWGTVLVIIGVLLLVGQFLPAVQLWRYWPLIIVALGIRAMFGSSGRPWSVRNLGDGLVTVAFGLVLLGQMIGFLQWDVWLNILRLWPLLLVALGIEVIGRSVRNDWVRAIGSLVIVAGIAYGALVMTPTGGWPFIVAPTAEGRSFDLSEPHLAGVETGTARIDGGVGSLTVTAGRDLVAAAGSSPYAPVFDASVEGNTAHVRVSPGSGSWSPGTPENVLDVTLDETVVWDVDIRSGVTRPDIDLRDLKIGSLRMDAGVSDGTLTLGRASNAGRDGAVGADIQTGVSSLTIRVPTGDDIRVSVGAGLTDTTIRGTWTSSRSGDRRIYESDGFSDAGAYWDINVRAGVSRVVVEYY